VQDALRAFGLCMAEGAALRPDEPQELYLWPCNRQAWGVFLACATQWRVGWGGATGLDYAAVRVVMDVEGVGKKHRAEVFQGVRAMEYAVLDEWERARAK